MLEVLTGSGRPRIAITGLGAVTPMGVGAEILLERWMAGDVAIVNGDVRCWDFDPSDFLNRWDARRADRFAQLAIVASDEALAQAGAEGELPAPAERVACVIATGVGGMHALEQDIETLRTEGPEEISPLGIPRLMGNAASAMVAMRHGMLGESCAIVAACASGSQVLGAGARMLYAGQADVVLAGGSDAHTTEFTKAAYSLMGATSEIGISRPFDRRRDGFVPSEGAAMLVLERYESAIARGAEILGELLGYGASSDAHHLTAPHPEARGAIRAMSAALADAGIEPEDIDYVNAHGTSTPLNDVMETRATKAVLQSHAYSVPVSSLKGAIGHLQGAAGAAEAVATLLALRARVAPPTLGLEEPDDGLDLDYVPRAAKPLPGPEERPVLTGISNSFGFGGHNATVVFRTPDAQAVSPPSTASAAPVT